MYTDSLKLMFLWQKKNKTHVLFLFFMNSLLIAFRTILFDFHPFWMISFILRSDIVFVSTFRTTEDDIFTHVSTPPTYRRLLYHKETQFSI